MEEPHTGGAQHEYDTAAVAATESFSTDPFAILAASVGDNANEAQDINMAHEGPALGANTVHDPFFEAIFTMPDPFGMSGSIDPTNSNMGTSSNRYMMSGGIGGLGSFPVTAIHPMANHQTMPTASPNDPGLFAGSNAPQPSRHNSDPSSSRSPPDEQRSGDQQSSSQTDASKRKLVPNAPLKRGNACLFCRKRKLKCDAERPRCKQCGRLNAQGECVYDDMLEAASNANGRPAASTRRANSGGNDGQQGGVGGGGGSGGPVRNGETSSARSKQGPYAKDKQERDRIRALEAHVQELEAKLRATSTSQAQTQNGGGTSAPLGAAAAAESMLSPATEDLLQRIMAQGIASAGAGGQANLNAFAADTTNSLLGHQLPMPFVDPVIPQGFDWSSLDPAMAGFATGFEASMATTFTMDAAHPTVHVPPPQSSTSSLSAGRSPGDSATTHFCAKNSSPLNKVEKVDFFGSESAMGDASASDQLVGGWFDPTDPPPFVRDKLLNLYFSFLSRFPVDIHIPRFYARLSRPKKDRPHPSWLFSMYLLGSRMATDDPNIRSLHTHFLQVAREQIQIGIDNLDRLLDVLRACNNLVMYYYASARYHEAWIQSGQAVQMAVLLGLHDIPSNDIKKVLQHLDRKGRDPLRRGVVRYGMLAPQDSIELAERISAWWQTFTVNLAGATATSWPPSIPERVATPFPRPMIEYELGIIVPEHDVTLADLLNGRITRAAMSPSTVVLRVQMLYLMQKANSALCNDPEPGVEITEIDFTQTPSPGSAEYPAFLAALSQKCVRHRRPAEFAQIEHALNAFIAELPPAFHDPVDRSPGASSDGSHVDLGTLCFQAFLATVQLFLYDIDDCRCPFPESLAAARRVSTLTQLVTPERWRSVEPFMAMVWTFSAKVLIKEVKRLRLEQDYIGAAAADAEVDNLIKAMSALGEDYGLAEMQVQSIAACRSYDPEDPQGGYRKAGDWA